MSTQYTNQLEVPIIQKPVLMPSKSCSALRFTSQTFAMVVVAVAFFAALFHEIARYLNVIANGTVLVSMPNTISSIECVRCEYEYNKKRNTLDNTAIQW